MNYCLHVKVFVADENNIYILLKIKNLTSTQNIYEKIDKQLKGFYHWIKTSIKTFPYEN